MSEKNFITLNLFNYAGLRVAIRVYKTKDGKNVINDMANGNAFIDLGYYLIVEFPERDKGVSSKMTYFNRTVMLTLFTLEQFKVELSKIIALLSSEKAHLVFGIGNDGNIFMKNIDAEYDKEVSNQIKNEFWTFVNTRNQSNDAVIWMKPSTVKRKIDGLEKIFPGYRLYLSTDSSYFVELTNTELLTIYRLFTNIDLVGISLSTLNAYINSKQQSLHTPGLYRKDTLERTEEQKTGIVPENVSGTLSVNKPNTVDTLFPKSNGFKTNN